MEIYEQLESEFASWCKKDYAVAVNSGTAALHLSLIALGVKEGDEVIVPDFAFASVAFSVTYCGATPIFVDCDNDYNLDYKKIKITPKTKAIIVVHTYGRKADISKFKKFGVPIIEDACEGQGIPLGDSDCAVYSFYRNKILSAQEGGIVVSNNKEFIDETRFLKNMANEDFSYYHPQLGFNYRMPNAQAELALNSLKNADKIIKERSRIEDMYLEEFGGKKHDTPWVFDFLRVERDKYLDIKGVRRFFHPQSTFPIYNKKPQKRTQLISNLGFVVALDPTLDHEDIIQQIKQYED